MCAISDEKIKVDKTVILPLIWYWYERWCATLNKYTDQGFLEIRVLRIIFGCKREEITEGSEKLYNEEHQGSGLTEYGSNRLVNS